jgi:hypothetical protein
MGKDRENPVALAGVNRVHVTVLAGNDDFLLGSPSALDLQVRHILKGYPLSLSVALVVAEHAFQAWRSR